MAFAWRCTSRPGATAADAWRYVGPAGEILGYSLPNDGREAVYRFESQGGPAAFIRYEGEPHGEIETRREWVRWHRRLARAEPMPPAPLETPPEPPELPSQPSTPDQSPTLTRADYGLQKRR